MNDYKKSTVSLLRTLREKTPLVHNITNFVVMNSSANILLALGAAPVMAHSEDEVEDMVSISNALVLNIGTLEDAWIKSMILAGNKANVAGIPVIFDPVGSGATRYRTDTSKRILDSVKITIVRGNASEIASLVSQGGKTRGVDSADNIEGIEAAALTLAAKHRLITAVSGQKDFITDGTNKAYVLNGHPLMTKVTGLGCGLTAVTGAFSAIAGSAHYFESAVAAFGFYGVCGEIAAAHAKTPGSFATAFIDAIYSAGALEIESFLKVEES